jgi:hypothetical protein
MLRIDLSWQTKLCATSVNQRFTFGSLFPQLFEQKRHASRKVCEVDKHFCFSNRMHACTYMRHARFASSGKQVKAKLDFAIRWICCIQVLECKTAGIVCNTKEQ